MGSRVPLALRAQRCMARGKARWTLRWPPTRPATKVLLTLLGASYLLTPDYQVTIGAQSDLVSTDTGSDFVVKAGKVYINYPFGFSQGFAVGAP